MARVLVADDSAVARKLLVEVLGRDSHLDVVGEASDGREAIALAERLRPDVIVMDVQMPVMDGLEATRRIMEERPAPIVMVTSAQPVDVAHSFRALEAGALTLLEKPAAPGNSRFDSLSNELRTTVRLMAGVKLVTRRPSRARVRERPPPRIVGPRRPQIDLVAIGASTGGPAALATILGALPPDFPAPILVVQHIAVGFEKGLVEWLGSVARPGVLLASAGQPLRPGTVLVAPHDRHLGVGDGRALLSTDGPIRGHRPSATYLFRSVARDRGPRAIGVILTGMGADGAAGLLELRRAGGFAIAQDKSSSVVYGMPREAVALGAVDTILALDQIGPALVAAVARR